MKCLIFSDSHGKELYMKRAIKSHPDAEVIFFLGDGLSDFAEVSRDVKCAACFSVRGNCDLGSSAFSSTDGKLDRINLLGKNVYFTHGDLYSVKYGTEKIEAMAEARGADIVLFGHTHIPMVKYVDPQEKYKEYQGPREIEGNRKITEENDLYENKKPYYLFNPGSIGGSDPTYGIMTLTDTSVLFSHGRFA